MKLLASVLFISLLCSFSDARHRPRKGYAARPRLDSPEGDGETYVLLVAGSNGWYNYRHQADLAHAYHVLIEHGIPAKNVITMMYDDVANHKQNPFKGKLFNRPHGQDVYQGVKVDYKGEDVTPKNFLNVLKGNASGIQGGNGRVLKTTQEDRIFVYFTDHGAVGLIAFPDEMLTAKDLNDALIWLHKHKKYSQLVFYLEACESGSMFDSVLRDDLNIYAITAANGHESSWGTYCENDMGLPCLGDLFSVNWMTDSDEEDLKVETLNHQFDLVKRETNLSHVMRYGDLTIAKESVGLFQGEQESDEWTPKSERARNSVNWPSRDIELNHLLHVQKTSNSLPEQKSATKRIYTLRKQRRAVKEIVHTVVAELLDTEAEQRRMFENRRPVLDLNCHHALVHAFDKYCIDLNENEYALKYVNVLNNLCLELGLEEVITQLPDICMDLDVDSHESSEEVY